MARQISKREQYLRLPVEVRKRVINWRYRRVKGNQKPKKIPVDPQGRALTDFNSNPRTVDFETAVRAVESGAASGIGLCITDSGLCGLDLDDCVHDGEVDDWAIEILEKCDSYAEFSPSGRGLHILMEGTPDCPNARQVACGNGHCDVFASNGYLTLTGKPVPGYEKKPLRNGAQIVAEIFDDLRKYSKAIKKLREKRRSRDLWKGDWEAYYGSQSEADLALVQYAAPALDYERELLEELVSRSGLGRKKWTDRPDYRARTIDKALAGRKKTKVTSDDSLIVDRLIRVSEENAANMQWLWDYRVPCGVFSAFAGEPAAGKGTGYTSMVAAVTKGNRWPDGSGRAPKGDVVIFTTEDDIATVIKPRILAAGGDPEHVFVFRERFTFQNDLAAFERMLEEIKPVWVILDPGKPYIGTLRNASDDAEIRTILDPVALVLAKHGVACTLIYHLTKDQNRAVLHRLLGSVAHVAYPRAVWAIGANPNDEGEPRLRGFIPVKNNCYDPERIGGLEFYIEGTDVDADGEVISEVPRAVWRDGAVMMMADDYFSKDKEGKEESAQRDAEDLLEEHGGEMSSVELQDQLAKRKHTRRTTRRAIENLDIERSHSGKKQRGQHKVRLVTRTTPRRHR